MVFILLRSYLCSGRTGRVRTGGDYINGPKRRQTRRLGLRYILFFFLRVFYILTNDNYSI
jgi:hypothetical protein